MYPLASILSKVVYNILVGNFNKHMTEENLSEAIERFTVAKLMFFYVDLLISSSVLY